MGDGTSCSATPKIGRVYDLLEEEGYLGQPQATLDSMAGLDIPEDAASQIKLVSALGKTNGATTSSSS